MSRLYDFFKTGGQYEHAPMMHVQDQKPQNTAGQTLVSGDNDRDLNTILTNEITGASLNSNEITLPAGTYFIDSDAQTVTGSVDAAGANYIKKIDDTVLLAGVSESTSGSYRNVARVSGQITLSSSTAIKLVSHAAPGLLNRGNLAPHEVYADLKIWKLDAIKTSPIIHDNKLYPVAGQGYVTGNMYGLEYSYTSANTITVTGGTCMDSLNSTALASFASQVVDIPTAINTIYNLFLCDDGVVRTDTDVDGNTIGGIRRWIGFVRTNASGDTIKFSMDGDTINSVIRSDNIITTSLTTTYSAIDVSHLVPVSRVKEMTVGGYGDNAPFVFSYDGVNNASNVVGVVGGTTDTSTTAWGNGVDGSSTLTIQGLQGKNTSTGAHLLAIRSYTLKR